MASTLHQAFLLGLHLPMDIGSVITFDSGLLLKHCIGHWVDLLLLPWV